MSNNNVAFLIIYQVDTWNNYGGFGILHTAPLCFVKHEYWHSGTILDTAHMLVPAQYRVRVLLYCMFYLLHPQQQHKELLLCE